MENYGKEILQGNIDLYLTHADHEYDIRFYRLQQLKNNRMQLKKLKSFRKMQAVDRLMISRSADSVLSCRKMSISLRGSLTLKTSARSNTIAGSHMDIRSIGPVQKKNLKIRLMKMQVSMPREDLS